MSLPIPPPFEDIVPLVDRAQMEEESSDTDDEHVVQDVASVPPQAIQALEDDERKRRYLDSVSIQRNWNRQGSLPLIRDNL